MQILISGVAGFLASHVADELIRQGNDVIGIDDLSGGYIENVPNNMQFYQGSITNIELINEIFEQNDIEVVYHLAAYAAEGLSPFIRKFNYENNLIGSINLINASINHGVKHFVFTSSIAVYGNEEMREDVAPKPIDPYGISKLAVELDLRAAHEQFGLNYTIFRPHNVYGPRQNLHDIYRNVVGIFLRNKLNNQTCKIFGDGRQTRSFTYIDDIVPIISNAHLAKDLLNDTFNIGSDTKYTINDLLGYLDITNFEYEPKRHEVQLTEPSHEKLRKLIQYKETTLLEGITAMELWAKKEYNYEEPRKFKNIEIYKNLPPSWTK